MSDQTNQAGEGAEPKDDKAPEANTADGADAKRDESGSGEVGNAGEDTTKLPPTDQANTSNGPNNAEAKRDAMAKSKTHAQFISRMAEAIPHFKFLAEQDFKDLPPAKVEAGRMALKRALTELVAIGILPAEAVSFE